MRFVCMVLVFGGLSVAGVTPAAADKHVCRAPLAEWRPREMLRDQLVAAGWSDIRIRIDDGCYKARAVNGSGERLDRKFDPATLAPLPPGGRAGHDDAAGHGEDGHGDD